MKHGKKPTRQEKKILVYKGLDPKEYLVIKRLSNELYIVHRISGEVTVLEV